VQLPKKAYVNSCFSNVFFIFYPFSFLIRHRNEKSWWHLGEKMRNCESMTHTSHTFEERKREGDVASLSFIS